jgi:hypothetical protein
MSAREQAQNEQTIAALMVVLIQGHTVESREGDFRISSAEGLTFLVTNAHAEPFAIVHEEFDDVRAAVSYFLDLCDGFSEPD